MKTTFKNKFFRGALLYNCKMTLLVIVVVTFSISHVSAVELSRIQTKQLQQLELQGQFGKDCNKCEILVDYGKDFLYAYRPLRWNEKKLTFKLLDLGKSLKVKIFVRTGSGDSKARAYRIKPLLKPAKIVNKTRSITKKNKHNIFQVEHKDPFGDKGVDKFEVNSKFTKCDEITTIFHQARIIIEKKRFGDARIEQKPASGCVKCSPLTVRWYHEPTGFINYQLHIQRREIKGLCSTQIRRK